MTDENFSQPRPLTVEELIVPLGNTRGPFPLTAMQLEEVAGVVKALKAAVSYEDDGGQPFGEGYHIHIEPIRITNDIPTTDGIEVLGWVVFDEFGPSFTQVAPTD